MLMRFDRFCLTWLVGLGCSAHAAGSDHLAWPTEPVSSACNATIRSTEHPERPVRVESYDGAGELVFGARNVEAETTREWLTWQDGRLVAVKTLLDHGATSGGCEVGDTCAEPARREAIELTLTYANGQLASITEAHRENESAPVTRATQIYSYEHGQLAAIGDTLRYAYDGGHVVRRTDGSRITTYEWRDDTLVATHDGGLVRSFSYDAGGRLVGEILRNEHGQLGSHDWQYDEGGRLAAVVEAEGGTAMWAHGSNFRYDNDGRLIETVRGEAREVRTYSGKCARNLGVPVSPTALGRGGAQACIRTPSGLIETCGLEDE
jgi:hypothetical protein